MDLVMAEISASEQIMTSFEDTGLRGLRETLPTEQVLEHPVDTREVLEDVDTPEDYQRILDLIAETGSPQAP